MVKTFNNYLGCCLDWNYKTRSEIDALSGMIDNARQITYRTFVKHVSIPSIIATDIYPFNDYYWKPGRSIELRLKDDWAVSFYRSKYRGKRVYYMSHSAIEYVFGQN